MAKDTSESKERFLAKLMLMRDSVMSAEDIKYIMQIYSNQIDTITNLKIKVQEQAEQLTIQSFENTVAKRKMVSVDKRQLNVIIAQGSTSKITINPCDGRVTLKVSKNATPDATERYIGLAKIVMQYESFLPFTYRGKIDYCKTDDVNFVTLRTETSKRIVQPLIFQFVE